MEPFRYEEVQGIPVTVISDWLKESPTLAAGMSAGQHYGLHREQDNPRAVVPNRDRLARALGFSLDAWTSATQVHGKNVVRVTRAERGAGNRKRETAIPAADGLVTDERDILLTAFYADCVPLLFWDSDHGAVGVAHAGWRGTVLGIAREMVERMKREFGTDPGSVRVAIGPSIGPCCYEVDDRVVDALKEQIPDLYDDIVQPKDNGRFMLDLKRANADILRQAGVENSRMSVTNFCTSCEERLFFSHRRDGEKTGRMVAWIGIRKDES